MKAGLAGVVIALSTFLGACAQTREVVGYYAGWKPQGAVAPGEATVINYAFAFVAPDGALVLDGGPAEAMALARLGQLKEQDPALRLVISVGGWTRSNRFSDMSSGPRSRDRFIRSAVAFLREHRFDGIDIDWEFPGAIGSPCPPGETCQRPEDKRNFALLARELRAALDQAGRLDGKRYLVTIAAGADEEFLGEGAQGTAWLGELARTLDWINLMSYDYHGAWERLAGLNAPLHPDPRDPVGTSVAASVKRLLDAGIPATKMTLGIPFYGKGWSGCGAGPEGDGLFQACSGLASGSARESFDFGFLTERGYLRRDAAGHFTVAGPGFVRGWSAQAQVPYLYEASSGVFITYDDEASVRAKAAFARELGLRGVMFWEFGADRQGVLRAVISDTLRP